jgi:hypothetical protein
MLRRLPALLTPHHPSQGQLPSISPLTSLPKTQPRKHFQAPPSKTRKRFRARLLQVVCLVRIRTLIGGRVLARVRHDKAWFRKEGHAVANRLVKRMVRECAVEGGASVVAALEMIAAKISRFRLEQAEI